MQGTRARAQGLVALAVLAALLVGLLADPPPAAAYSGAPWFEPGEVYRSNFPDPSVVRVGGKYYAYGTSTGGAYLPVLRSTDLTTWTARPAYDPGPPLNADPYFNDALPHPASWAVDVSGGARLTKQVWAPGVARIGDRWVAFYAVRIRVSPARYCISVATASSPQGPFRDTSKAPLVCDADPAGSIDPQPFVDPATGVPYLLWKSEGVVGSQPTRLWIRQLAGDGVRFASGSRQRELLRTSQSWEGNLIENPSMVRHGGQLYLFYSANEWNSSHYAVGYARCAKVLGPCTKPHSRPLLASRGDRLGPGGPSAFVDDAGRLRLAYHYWSAPHTSYPAYPQCVSQSSCESQGQRRLAVTELSASAVGLYVGPPRPAPVPRATAGACPGTRVPEDGFGDVAATNVHEGAVDCVAWWKVAAGRQPGRYAPGAGVSREQMASFLVRAILRSGGTLPRPGRDVFADDDGSVHEDNINRLAAAGIVAGRSATRFAPGQAVSREQMATFLARASRYRTGTALSGAADYFVDDDGSVHQAAINAAATAGLAAGTGAATYSPTATVRRDQMATFLARLLAQFVEEGAPLPA